MIFSDFLIGLERVLLSGDFPVRSVGHCLSCFRRWLDIVLIFSVLLFCFTADYAAVFFRRHRRRLVAATPAKQA
jgi:hypothetical protein